MTDAIDDREALARILRGAGLPDEAARAPGDPALEGDVLAELERLAAELPGADEGGTRIIVAGRHISLSDAGWRLLTSLAALGISSLDPTGLTRIIVLKEVLALLKELRPLLRRLDPAKQLVCAAIAEIAAAKLRQGLDERGASEAEIAAHFTARQETVPVRLGDVLKSLASDKVVDVVHQPHSGPFYAVRF